MAAWQVSRRPIWSSDWRCLLRRVDVSPCAGCFESCACSIGGTVTRTAVYPSRHSVGYSTLGAVWRDRDHATKISSFVKHRREFASPICLSWEGRCAVAFSHGRPSKWACVAATDLRRYPRTPQRGVPTSLGDRRSADWKSAIQQTRRSALLGLHSVIPQLGAQSCPPLYRSKAVFVPLINFQVGLFARTRLPTGWLHSHELAPAIALLTQLGSVC